MSTRTDTLFPYTTLFRSHRHDIVIGVVQFVERGIKRGRFSRTRRAGHENQAVRRIDRRLEAAEGVLVHAELFNARGEIPFVEHTERSEEHTSELQSLIRLSYAVFCFNNKTNDIQSH